VVLSACYKRRNKGTAGCAAVVCDTVAFDFGGGCLAQSVDAQFRPNLTSSFSNIAWAKGGPELLISLFNY